MLRREKTSVVDGVQICQIPPKVVELQNVEFNDEERALYKAIETNSQLTFNRYLQKGTVNNNYANVLVLLLRLRQACCHPHLITDLGVQVSTEGIAEDDLLTRAKEINPEVVVRLKDADGFECPICLEVDLNPTIIIPCGHTCCGECFQKLIDPTVAIREGNDEATAPRCPHCRGTLSSKKITDYKHFCKVFCPERLEESDRPEEEVEVEEEEEEDSDSDDDDEGKDAINDEGDLDGFVVPDDADDDYEAPSPINGPEDTPEEAATKTKSKKGKGKARAGPKKPKMTLAQLKKESLRNKAAKKKYLRRLRKTYVSSGKIEKTIELLREIQSNDPTEKTLIFSQFTSLLDLVEVPLSDTGIKYQRYDGSMKMDERAEAVNQFMDDASQKVMLISLKAGNAGLNLSKASHVIMLDPFWNPFIEDQAVDRAHRMPVSFHTIAFQPLYLQCNSKNVRSMFTVCWCLRPSRTESAPCKTRSASSSMRPWMRKPARVSRV
jgi:SNF2 family DNA or RNA helicase